MIGKVVSLFAGVGGLDYGFSERGFDISYVNEFHENTARSYELIHGTTVDTADINQVILDELPDCDLIIGGPPCQSFSLVGKRKPNDPRGKCVFKFLEAVKKKQPTAFVMENVPGIRASWVEEEPGKKRRLIEFLKNEFRELGYQVNDLKLKAIEYGVPQRRERIVLFGSMNGLASMPNSEVFFDELGFSADGYETSARAAIGDLGKPVGKGKLARYNGEEISDFASLMRMKVETGITLHEMPRMSKRDLAYVESIPPGGNYRDIPDEISTPRVMYFKSTGGRTTTYGRLHPDRPSYTINTAFRRPNVGCNFHYSEKRLITPREAMRFQSMPDNWTLHYSAQDERNAMIGNAVPPLLSRAISIAVEDVL